MPSVNSAEDIIFADCPCSDRRSRAPRTFVGGVVLLTASLVAAGAEVRAEVLRRVRAYDRFNPDNDPYGDHDFGSFTIAERPSTGRSPTTTWVWSSARRILRTRRLRVAFSSSARLQIGRRTACCQKPN